MRVLADAARDLCRAVDGADWSASDVRACHERLSAARDATAEELAEAAHILVERLRHASVDDADGAAQVALAAGGLVERGAPAEPLARVLGAHMTSVLLSARRFADRCVDALPKATDDGDAPDDDTIIQVDERCVSRALFRELLPLDPAGGCALVYLEQWVLPAIAALSRCRPELLRARADEVLRDAATSMTSSDAHFLPILLGAEMGETWTVHVPLEQRAFEVVLDGVVSNFELHTLLAGALIPAGVTGDAPSPALLAYLEGHGPPPPDAYVAGVWNIYDHRALGQDLSRPNTLSPDCWVWGEGRPAHVVAGSGQRVLVLGPPAYQRTWNVGRTFSALPQSVRLLRELSSSG